MHQVEIQRTGGSGALYEKRTVQGAYARSGNRLMPQLVVVKWRDIPAQVMVRQGRKAAKRQLPERFEQAIDRCAMKVGARDTDAYLSEWRKSDPVEVEGDPEVLAAAEADRIDVEFDAARIKQLIANNGWAEARSDVEG